MFYYATLGYHLDDKLFAYGSYWFSEEGFDLRTGPTNLQDELDVEVFTTGLRYTVLRDEVGFDRVTLKAQYARVLIRATGVGTDQFGEPVNFIHKPKLHLFGLGVSVLF